MTFPARALIFDLDGTLTPVPSPWRLVHERFGLWEQACSYHDAFFRGEITYETWCHLDAGLWEGRTLDEVRDVLSDIHPTDEALTVLAQTAAYRDRQARPLALMVLSSGFEELGQRVVRQAGLEPGRVTVVANRLIEQDGRIVAVPRVVLGDPRRDKRSHTATFLEVNHCPASLAVALDDRIEDQEIFSHLGAFIHVQEPKDLLKVLNYLE